MEKKTLTITYRVSRADPGVFGVTLPCGAKGLGWTEGDALVNAIVNQRDKFGGILLPKSLTEVFKLEG